MSSERQSEMYTLVAPGTLGRTPRTLAVVGTWTPDGDGPLSALLTVTMTDSVEEAERWRAKLEAGERPMTPTGPGRRVEPNVVDIRPPDVLSSNHPDLLPKR